MKNDKTTSNNGHTTMEDHDIALIGDFFKDLDRQGPCDRGLTLKALEMVGRLPDNARIADLGCGTGGQTMTLAQATGGHITAIDLMPAFIMSLRERIAGAGLTERVSAMEGSMGELPFATERVSAMEGSMGELPFAEGELDLIWSEGAIYHIGYSYGLNYWNRFLRPGGFVVVSEATWFTPQRPAGIDEFWKEAPGIDTIPVKVAQMQDAGYIPVAHFTMPESAWWDYYNPIRANYDAFMERHGHSEAAKTMLEYFEYEVELYEKYSKYYGYAFYIGQKL